MVARQVGLPDVRQGRARSKLRLAAPLRYLLIYHPEKTRYDLVAPVVGAALIVAFILLVRPAPPIFGDNGLLKFTRELLIMAVPFMVGALAAVAMGAPGPHLDRRPVGAELLLEGEVLSLRQFTCYLLGYLCFLGIVTLGAVVLAPLLRDQVITIFKAWPIGMKASWLLGVSVFALLLSSLTVTVLWALYFLTDVVNRGAAKVVAPPSAPSEPPDPSH